MHRRKATSFRQHCLREGQIERKWFCGNLSTSNSHLAQQVRKPLWARSLTDIDHPLCCDRSVPNRVAPERFHDARKLVNEFPKAIMRDAHDLAGGYRSQ